MKALLKIMGWLLGLVVVVIIAVILILPKVFDPNDHKDRIEALVLDKTGRVLTIDGDLSLSIFPNVAVKTGVLTLSNPDGGSFGESKMIEIEEASMDVRLVPLLSKQVEAGEVVFKKPVIRLITLADGTTNWQDLQGGEDVSEPTETSSSPDAALAALAIQGVRVEDGQVLWDDRSTDTRYDVTALSLTTGMIMPARDIPVDLSANVQGQALPEPLDFKLTGDARLETDNNQLFVSNLDLSALGQTINAGVNAPSINFDLTTSQLKSEVLNLTAKVDGNDINASLPALLVDLNAQKITSTGIQAALDGAATARLSTSDVAVDLAAGQVALSNLNAEAVAGENSAKIALPSFTTGFDQRKFELDAVAVDAMISELPARVEFPRLSIDAENMNVEALGATISAEGVVASLDINATNIVEALQFGGRLRLPQSDLRAVAAKAAAYQSQDPAALSAVSLDVEFSGTPELIEIPTLIGMLDETSLEGSATVNLAEPAYSLRLRGGALDLDRYMPQPTEGVPAPEPQPADSAAAVATAPVALGSLRIAADVALEQLKMQSAGIVVDNLLINSVADGSGPVPLTVTGLVGGEALPESVNLNLEANLEGIGETLKLQNLAVKANGETLNVELNVPQVVLDTSKPISVADLSGSFAMADNAADVTVTSISFDTEGGDLSVDGLKAATTFAGINANINAGKVTGDVETQAFDLSDLSVAIDRESPIGTVSAPALSLDLKQQTARAADITFLGDAGQATLQIAATSIIDAPSLDGSISASNFNVRQLMEQLDVAPEFQDPQVLTSVSIDSAIKGGLDAFSLEPLKVTLDDTPIDGFVRVQQNPTASYVYDINVGTINLDRYTPIAEAPSDDSSAESGNAAAAVVGPAEILKNLTVDGTVRVQSLTTGGMDLGNVVVSTKSENGIVTMAPISAQLYDGQADGSVVIDTNGDVPVITADQSLINLNLGPALAGAGISEKLSGTGNLIAKITATGVDAASISESMKGTVSFDLKDGAMQGFDLQKILVSARQAYEQYKDRDSMFEGELEEQTKFSAMTGTLVLGDGNATNNDLTIMAPLFRITGEGAASLVEQTLDYGLSVNLVKSVEGQGGAELDELQGVAIPVRITGPFTEPAFSVDLVGLLKDKAKQEAKDKLKEKLSEELGLPQTTATDGEPQSTKDTLKGLLRQKAEDEIGLSEQPAPDASQTDVESAASPEAKPERKRSKDILRDMLTKEVQRQTGGDNPDSAAEPAAGASDSQTQSEEPQGRLDDLINDDTSSEPQADTAQRRSLDDLLDASEAAEQRPASGDAAAEPAEQPQQSAEDQVKDELKKKLLKKLFD